MSETMGPTAREGLLASLLMHACLVILLLLFPDTFTPDRARAVAEDPNEPIPLAFLSESDKPELNSPVFGDAGDEERSDPRPEEAPPPENDDPFSVGNNPNRFLAPPMSEPATPSPQPPSLTEAEGEPTEAADPPEAQTVAAGSGDDGDQTRGDASGGDDDPLTVADAGDLLMPPPDREEGSARGAPGAEGGLRDAIGRMSTGLSGGVPLRFHNPIGGLSGPVGGLSFDTAGFDWGAYARRIYWIIFTNWIQGWPPAARAGLAGTVSVRFKIHRDGTLDGIRVISPSGTPAFDTAATLALEASNPLPPLPADFPGESEGVTGRFLYNVKP